MKKARKLITFILTVVMVLSMSLNVWAEAGTNTNDGIITIKNPSEGVSYSVYQILTLESYDTEKNAYVYKATDAWKQWLIDGSYVDVDENGYVTGLEEAEVEEFAKAAMEFAEGITPTKSVVAQSGSAQIEGLSLGYYLVDSSQGVLCSLDTAAKAVDIREKNVAPTITKKVKTSSDPENWDVENTVNIGETVEFKVTISAKPGAENYVLHDTLDSGLDFDEDSVEIAGLTEGTDYTITTDTDGCCTFEIEFTKTYLDKIENPIDIAVTYSAVLTEGANVGSVGNANTTYLEYAEKPYVDTDGDGTPDDTDTDDDNDNTPDDTDTDDDNDGTPDTEEKPSKEPTTPPSETKTYTYSFDLVKTDSDGKLLDGATFKLYTDEDCQGNPIAFTLDGTTYTFNASGTLTDITVTDGKVKINGLAAGEYYLKETDAPDGYNLLTEITTVTIVDENLDAIMNETDPTLYKENGIRVINNTGSLLPSTGGIGTTIFYIVGGALVLFAVVLLVTKKRMKDTQ